MIKYSEQYLAYNNLTINLDQNQDIKRSALIKQENEKILKKSEKLVFLSYDKSDEKLVIEICNELKSHGIGCWICNYDLPGSQGISDRISKGIDTCIIFCNIATKNYCQKYHDENDGFWIKREYNTAVSNKKRILTVLVEVSIEEVRSCDIGMISVLCVPCDNIVNEIKKLLI